MMHILSLRRMGLTAALSAALSITLAACTAVGPDYHPDTCLLYTSDAADE